jgi:transposase
MLAMASALEGMTRAAAARLAGMERQALRDAVVRFNAEGLDGLRDRPKPGRPPALTEPEQTLLLAAVFRGPERVRYGCTDWTLPGLCRWIEDRFDKRLHLGLLEEAQACIEARNRFDEPLRVDEIRRGLAGYAICDIFVERLLKAGVPE